MNDIERINQKYYNTLYRPSNVFLRWLHSKVSFDQKSKQHPNQAAVAPVLESILQGKGQARVLDYGCGWGLFLLSLPTKKQTEAFCYDISDNAMAGLEAVMDMFNRRVKRITFDEDGKILPDDFDIIVCSHVFEHVANDVALAAKLVAALRPGGYLLVNVPINEVWPDPKHARSYDSETLEKLLVAAGLTVEMKTEACKLGEILRQNGSSKEFSKIKSVLIRSLRAFFGLLPYRIILLIEKNFLSNRHYEHLIIVGRK